MYTSTTSSSLSTVSFERFYIGILIGFSLRSFHRFKPNYARRLINALIENTPFTEEIFTSNEQVTNNSIRCENPIKN